MIRVHYTIGFLLLIFCVMGINTQAQLIAHNFTTYNSELGSNKVYKILCDADGYIWFGSNRGLFKFDGSRFKHIDKMPGKEGNEICNLYYNKVHQKIIPLLMDGTIFQVNARTDSIQNFGIKLSYPLIYYFNIGEIEKYISNNSVVKLQKGKVIVSSFTKEVYKEFLNSNPLSDAVPFNPQLHILSSWDTIKNFLPFESQTFNRSRIGNYGMLLFEKQIFAQKKGLLYRLLDVSEWDKDPNTFIVDVEVRNDDLYIALAGVNGGVYFGENYFKNPFDCHFEKISCTGFATSVCIDKIGNVWYSILDKGVFCIPRALKIPLLETDKEYTQIKVFEDHTIVLKSNENNFDQIKIPNSIINESSHTITTTIQQLINAYQSSYFFVRDKEVVNILDGFRFVDHQNQSRFYPNRIEYFNKDFTKKIIYKIDTAVLSKILPKCGDRYITEVLICTNQGDIYQYTLKLGDINNPKWIGKIPQTNHIFFQDKNQIVFLTSAGVFINNLSLKHPLKISSKTYEKVQYRSGVFYFINQSELAKYDPICDKEIKVIFSEKYEGCRFSIVNFDLGKSIIYILTDKGVLLFDPQRYIPKTKTDVRFSLSHIINDKQTIYVQDTAFYWENPPKSELLFKVHFLNIENEQYTKHYSISKKGEPERWFVFKGNEFVYNNIKPGNYILKIKVSLPELGIDKIIQYQLFITPRFWQTTWFSLIMILLVAFASVSITYILLMKRQKKKFEKLSIEKEIEELENRVFLNQLNPHFLFNSLNTLQSYIIKKDTHNGIKYLQNIAGLSRSIIDFHRSSTISVAQEIEFLEKYLYVQQQRFKEKFQFKMVCLPGVAEDKIPPMLLQPLVENAIEHGMKGLDYKGEILINFERIGLNLIVTIADNGSGRIEDIYPFKEGHALSIINQRLNLSSNNRKLDINFVSIHNNVPKGIILIIKIPQ